MGISTVLVDNPSLSTRHLEGRTKDPRPIVVDANLKCPLDVRFISRRPILLCLKSALHSENAGKLRDVGAELLAVNASAKNENRIDLKDAFTKLFNMGLKSLMIEGGARIIQECLTNPEIPIDLLIVTIAPKLLGNGVHGLCGLDSHDGNAPMPILKDVEWKIYGSDIVLVAKVVY